MKIKLRNVLLLTVVPLAVFLLLFWVIYATTRTIAEETILDHQRNIVAHAAATTDMWLQLQKKVMRSVIEEIDRIDSHDNAAVLRVLEQALKAGEFSDVYLGLDDGTMIDGAGWLPPTGYDPRNRPWYLHGMVNSEISLSSPYVDMTTGQMVIAMTSPLLRNGQLYGVVSGDIILDSLVNNVINLKVGDKGYSFIISANGTIVVHPDQSLLMTHKLQDLDGSLKGVIAAFQRNAQGTYKYFLHGKENILAYQFLDDVDWYLCTTMSTAEAYALSGKTSMLSAMEAVLKLLGVFAGIALLGVGGSALGLLFFNKRFQFTVKQHQDVINGMNEDLKWNITRRKAIETHYQTLFHVANDAIMVSKGTVFVECNERAREMLGAREYGIIGNNMLDISPAYQADGKSSYQHLQKIIDAAGLGKQQFFQWTFLRSNGSEFPAEVSLKKLHLNNEQLILMSIRDISKRATAEQQLRQAQKMAAMGEMLGAIAHQWRQPLNTLSTYVSSLQSAFYNQLINREFVDKLVQNADTQIQFMSKTIDDFRQFFKPSKTKERFSLIKSVENAIKLVEPSFRQTDVAIRVQQPQAVEDFLVYGYQSEFSHVIVNILSNAKDAVNGAGASDDKLIEIAFEVDEENVKVTISDSGPGIPEPILGQIFTPYFTTKGTASGTGLGLYMAKVIVENEMNGRLVAENCRTGARFTILLPKAETV
ncbi:cache domain-containing protein [Pelobacter seleniigenes]|uniref:cache domain-containing protein n=1 Tax=Pelobacter seleniigenes TaxID=407188 RepID=UPI0004A6D330|nr:cache domain-containing protein [Pelobacter seleniigenes]